MQDQRGWKVVTKTKKLKKPKNINVTSDSDQETSTSSETSSNNNIPDGSLELIDKYVLWCHDIYNKDWSLNGYTNLCTIKNVSEFWKLFNNLDKIGYKTNNFFLMKEGTDPTWEHVNNRNGGICSFKTEISNSLTLYEELCSYMVCNILVKNMDDINGISFSPKNNWAVIKIWNKDKKNDISKELNSQIREKYKNIGIRYKTNEPEY